MTRYAVLRSSGEAGWVLLGNAEGNSDEAAIRNYLNGHNQESSEAINPGTFVAVPTRSWHPRRVQMHTHTRLKIS